MPCPPSASTAVPQTHEWARPAGNISGGRLMIGGRSTGRRLTTAVVGDAASQRNRWQARTVWSRRGYARLPTASSVSPTPNAPPPLCVATFDGHPPPGLLRQASDPKPAGHHVRNRGSGPADFDVVAGQQPPQVAVGRGQFRAATAADLKPRLRHVRPPIHVRTSRAFKRKYAYPVVAPGVGTTDSTPADPTSKRTERCPGRVPTPSAAEAVYFCGGMNRNYCVSGTGGAPTSDVTTGATGRGGVGPDDGNSEPGIRSNVVGRAVTGTLVRTHQGGRRRRGVCATAGAARWPPTHQPRRRPAAAPLGFVSSRRRGSGRRAKTRDPGCGQGPSADRET
jgi:hypothetical protein